MLSLTTLELVRDGELAVASDACEERGWSLPIARLIAGTWLRGYSENFTHSGLPRGSYTGRKWISQSAVGSIGWYVKHMAWYRARCGQFSRSSYKRSWGSSSKAT